MSYPKRSQNTKVNLAMTHCPNCNTEVFPDAKFCHNCGTSLNAGNSPAPPSVTDTGGSVLKAAQKSAASGLDSINLNGQHSPANQKHRGERRIVTILFSDVKGSTALAENLDPEEVLEIMNKAFKILIDPVVKYEGKVARLMGDAILAFFGAPVSHEDDADRACRAGLEIIEGAKVFAHKLKKEKGIEGFNVRVGINTGLVVVGEVGAGSNVEYTAMGDAVNTAARMESSAEPGTIQITEETKKHLQSEFMFLDLGGLQVKGRKEPVKTFRLLSLPGKTSEKFIHPIVARENELKLIENAFKNLAAKKGGIVSIYGDNGVGKTRLLQESKKLFSSGINWIEGKAEAYTLNNSYWMARTFLKNYFDFRPGESSADMEKKLKSRLEQFDAGTPETIGFLLYFMNIKAADRKDDEMLKLSPEIFNGRLHYVIKELLTHEIVNRPTVLVWDNLQWCDAPSRELLKEIMYLSNELPLLLLLIYRLDESEKATWDFHHSYIETPGFKNTLIRLNAFNQEESHQHIKLLLNAEEVPPDLMDKVYDRTQGNALFIEEVLNSFLEKGIIRRNGIHVEAGDFNKECMVPDLLHNVLMSRIDSLGQGEKRVLQTASVIGRIFQEKLLAHILKDEYENNELKDILRKLQHKELILRHLSSGTNIKLLKEREYVFKHPLMQEVVYSTLFLSHRQQLHKSIGDAIETLNEAVLEDHIYSLGPHFEKGKDHLKAFGYYMQSGDKAAELFSKEDALFYYEKALEQTHIAEPAEGQLIKLHNCLGDAYSSAAQYSLAVEHYNQSLKYDKGDSCRISGVYRKIGHIHQNQGHYEKAHEYFDLSLDLIGGCNEFEAALTYLFKSMVFFRENKFDDAEKISESALNILLKYEDKYHLAEAYNNLGNICSSTNQYAKSHHFYTECIKIREEINDQPGLAAVYNNIGNLFQIENDLDKAIDSYTRSLSLCEKTGNYHGLARVYDNLCSIYTLMGDEEKAMDYNLKAIGIIGRIAKEASQVNSNIWLQSGVW